MPQGRTKRFQWLSAIPLVTRPSRPVTAQNRLLTTRTNSRQNRTRAARRHTPYWSRSATEGSTLVALLAGIQQASNATSVRMAGTSTNMMVSPGPAVNNMLFTALDATIAMAVPKIGRAHV